MVAQLEDHFLGIQRSGCSSHEGMLGLDIKESLAPKCHQSSLIYHFLVVFSLASWLLNV